MNNKRRYFWIIGFFACILLLLIAGLVLTVFRSGIHVTVRNSGSQPLRSVVLHVTRASYDLGDIAPGEMASAIVSPTGESNLEIEFTDPDGQTQRLDAGGYFESGYKGTIRVSIKGGKIQENEQNIKLPWSLP
jgi:hypothetical protein